MAKIMRFVCDQCEKTMYVVPDRDLPYEWIEVKRPNNQDMHFCGGCLRLEDVKKMLSTMSPTYLAAIDAVALRATTGIVHDPGGCYTIGPTIPSGALALLAHTPRADHSQESTWTSPRAAATAFVEIIGAEQAMVACRNFDARR